MSKYHIYLYYIWLMGAFLMLNEDNLVKTKGIKEWKRMIAIDGDGGNLLVLSPNAKVGDHN